MLVLTRKQSETIKIGNDIEIMVTQIGHGKVKLGINAPANVRIIRSELIPATSKPGSHVQEAPEAMERPLVAEAAYDFSEEDLHPVSFDEPPMEFDTEYAAEIEDQMVCVPVLSL